MKTLYVSVLVCAMMALARAAAISAETPENGQTVKRHRVKRAVLCSRPWVEFSGRCFHYVPQPLSWARAERNCHSMGGNLASVHNMMQYHKLQRLIMRASYEYKETWIGGSDGQEENHWLWTDGTPFQYTNWCAGEPNNYGSRQSCLVMNHGNGKCWDDRQCRFRMPSICAKKR